MTLSSNKTRIGFQARMHFAAVMIRKDYLRGGLCLARGVRDKRFFKVESFSPRNHVHHFRIHSPRPMPSASRNACADGDGPTEEPTWT